MFVFMLVVKGVDVGREGMIVSATAAYERALLAVRKACATACVP